MARFSFDPKKLFTSNAFGKNDLTLYAESDIIGLKNYPQYVPPRKDRMLTMFGFNFPEIKSIKYLPGISSLADSRVFNSIINAINIRYSKP